MKPGSVVVGVIALFGCLTPEQRAANQLAYQQRVERANAPVICQTKDECEAAWGRAVGWVSEKCGWKIRTQTDYLIETHGPMDARSMVVACRVNRVPIDSKSQRFDLAASCANMFGCSPDILEMKASFADTINGFTRTMRLPETVPADE